MTSDNKNTMHILLWGSCDLSKSRAKTTLECLNALDNVTVQHIHWDVWRRKKKDASRLSLWSWLRIAVHLCIAYPCLIIRYLMAPKHDCVLIMYPGWLDVVVLKPFSALRRRPIIWDMFISLYDTAVIDRGLIKSSLARRIIYALDRLAAKSSNIVVLDTDTHCDYVANLLKLRREKLRYSFVGSASHFRPISADNHPSNTPTNPQGSDRITILFYGQMIPLHGIDIIMGAAMLSGDPRVDWHIVGSGQCDQFVIERLSAHPKNITYTPWVAYEELSALIVRSDICLGIFGSSVKAHHVIPHKVYECLAMGKRVVTLDSQAIHEIYPLAQSNLHLVKQPSSSQLWQAIQRVISQEPNQVRPINFNKVIANQWRSILCLIDNNSNR